MLGGQEGVEIFFNWGSFGWSQCMFPTCNVIIRHLYILQHSHHQGSTSHPSPCHWLPLLILPSPRPLPLWWPPICCLVLWVCFPITLMSWQGVCLCRLSFQQTAVSKASPDCTNNWKTIICMRIRQLQDEIRESKDHTTVTDWRIFSCYGQKSI